MTQTTVQRGGATAQQTTVTARIVSVDPNANTVTVQGPQGLMHSLKVKDPDLQARLSRLRPGDTVTVMYTRAMAISVQPTP